jgi:hypothetical protein
MSEKYMEEYEQQMLRTFERSQEQDDPVGYISYAAVRAIHDSGLELSWYPNVFDRFHEVMVTLHKVDFVTCVGSWRWDEKPHIFVKDGWLNNLHLRRYSVFGLIDAIGMKAAIRKGSITHERLIALRDDIDRLGQSHPEVSFISFGDSILVKSNWSVGMVNSTVQYTYNPEVLLPIIKDMQISFGKTLGLSAYAVLTQGHNEYYDDALIHVSVSKNHICLNSLGLPFAQLLAIDSAARSNITEEVHLPAEIYMDEHLFRSFRFGPRFRKDEQRKYYFTSKMSIAPAYYYAAQLEEILGDHAPTVPHPRDSLS